MNLRKRSPATDNEKVVNLCLSKLIKHWPENVRRKRTAQLQLNSLDNTIPGRCIKKSAMGWVELAKPLDDNDRKMLFSLAAMDSDTTSELQGFLKSSGARCKAITEGSCKTKRVWCPNVGTLSNDLAVNPSSVKKYPKQLRIGGAPCLNEEPIKFVNCPEIIRKKRSSSSLSQVGSVHPGKRQKGARQKIQMFSTYSVPEEVIEEILSRLPVKSIARFRCVCKSWEHLSYSKRFISLHLNNYRTSQFLVGTSGMFSRCVMYFLQPPPPTGDYCYEGGATNEILKHEFPHLFGGCCNGIVCLYGEYAVDDIVLWNPGTNEFKRIRGLGEFSYRSKCTVVLGYDPLTDDYKILKMVYGKLDPPVAQLELYSLRKGFWKIVDCHEFLVVHGPDGIACSLPFTNNRIVCAVVSPINGASKWEVIKFDMSRETYEVISMPPSIDAELGDPSPDNYKDGYFKLLPLKESIALGIVHSVGMGSYCDVWVLNDLSCTQRTGRCWSKLLSTNVNMGDTVPVGSWGSSEMIFQETSSTRLYIHLELDPHHDNSSRMMELRGVVPQVWRFTAPYKESLVRMITDTKEAQDSN